MSFVWVIECYKCEWLNVIRVSDWMLFVWVIECYSCEWLNVIRVSDWKLFVSYHFFYFKLNSNVRFDDLAGLVGLFFDDFL